MKTMPRRPSTILARLVLTAFLASSPGTREAWSLTIGRVTPIGARTGVSMTSGLATNPSIIPLSLPSTLISAAITPAAAPDGEKPDAAKAGLLNAALQAKALNTSALSDGASRSAAASAFEGSDSKRSDSVPGAFPALPPPASADLAPAQPTRPQIEAMRGALAKNVKPGAALDRAAISELSTGAGVPVTQGLAAIEQLARESQSARLSVGVYIYSKAVQRDSLRVDDPMLDQANSKMIDGIDRLNTGGSHAQARAITYFGEAMRLFAQTGDDDARAEATILYKNAVLELTRRFLAEYNGTLNENSQNLDTRVSRINIALIQDALGGYYAAGKIDPSPLGRTQSAWLNNVLMRHQLDDDPEADADSRAITTGWALLQAFHQGAPLPDAGVKTVPPAERRRALFPLIDKQDDRYKTLNTFGVNVTRSAVEGALSPMIGRKAELRQIVKTLLRVEKNNPLIIGEKGVGKTAIANGLAQMIVDGQIPELEGVNIIKLDLTKVVAGTKYRGDFEKRMVDILDEARSSKGKVRLFIDEIHTIISAGDKDGSMDAAGILKEALADGSISVIGATTMAEYRKIEKDGALARRFNPVKLLPPSKDEAELIVEGVKGRYEAKHRVTVSPETVKAVVAMATRYITDRHLPDSALDLLDDAGAEVELKASEAARAGVEDARREVLPEDIAQEIALRTGIPAGKVGTAEREQLKDLPKDLGSKVVGQDEAINRVAKGVQRGRMGLRNTKQPIGTFIFLGPTGVGKTEVARQTAKTVYGSEKNMVRLDMSEYMEKHSVSRMIGAPPGYVGHDQAGQLTEAVRRNPHSVILLDEIEKAHPEVLDILLQVIEDGRLTDSQGRTVDFSNTIIMMTSNIGGSLAGDAEGVDAPKRRSMGFINNAEPEEAATFTTDTRRANYFAALKAKMRPEFINRVGTDGIVVFNELGKPEMESILTLRVKDLEDQLKERGVTVTLSAAAKTEILKLADAQKQYGARPLKQIVERQLADVIVSAELESRIAEGDSVVVDWDAAKGAFTADKRP